VFSTLAAAVSDGVTTGGSVVSGFGLTSSLDSLATGLVCSPVFCSYCDPSVAGAGVGVTATGDSDSEFTGAGCVAAAFSVLPV